MISPLRKQSGRGDYSSRVASAVGVRPAERVQALWRNDRRSADSVGGGQTSELTELSIREAADLVRRRKVSPLDLTRACLDRIERLNPLMNAFITVTAEQAMAQAREAEAEVRRGRWRGPLHGIPVGLKDNIDTAGSGLHRPAPSLETAFPPRTQKSYDG